MTFADTINGAFEFWGGISMLNNCRVVLRDKQVKGVSIESTTFFTCWGLWNLYYYPSLGQWSSFAGGLMIVTANTIYVALMIYYRRRNAKAK